jgi:hypothetical protein
MPFFSTRRMLSPLFQMNSLTTKWMDQACVDYPKQSVHNGVQNCIGNALLLLRPQVREHRQR